ncbi:MAG: hypothetical protein JXA73_23895 [Acidobacteria bacterium]|nr:hypothetical protein [Acidobacteriota bacterium]
MEVKDLVGEIAKRAPIMANRTLDLLRRIYKWGIEEDIVAASPCYPIRKPGEEHTRDRILTEDEIKKVMTGMGVPRLVVGKILNQVEPGVTKVYDRHSYDKEKREALDSWSKRLMVLVSNLQAIQKTEAI